MKSTGADLAKAEAQALDYKESLTEHERPDLVITSDFKHFRLLDLAADSPETELLEFPLEELPAHVEDLMFLTGYRRAKFGSTEQETASTSGTITAATALHHYAGLNSGREGDRGVEGRLQVLPGALDLLLELFRREVTVAV